MEHKCTFPLIIFCLFLSIPRSNAQWDSLYASPHNERLHDLKWIPAGNKLLITGEAEVKDKQLQGLFMVVDGYTGTIIKRLYFGGRQDDVLYSAAQANDGTYFLVGYTESGTGPNGRDGWVIHLNETFELVSDESRTLKTPGNDELRTIVWDRIRNRGIATGTKHTYPKGYLWRLSIQPSGYIEKNEETGDGGVENIIGAVTSRNGEVWTYGKTRKADGYRKGDAWFQLMAPHSASAGVETVGQVLEESISNAHTMYNGDILFCGSIDYQNGTEAGWITKLTKGENISQPKIFEKESLGSEYIYAITSDPDKNIYAMIGAEGKIKMLEMNEAGGTWIINSQMSIGNSKRLYPKSLLRTQNNFFVLAGNDQQGKRDQIRLFSTLYTPDGLIKSNRRITDNGGRHRLVCTEPIFEDNDGNGVLSAGEYGSLQFVVQNTGNAPFNGGKYHIKQLNGTDIINITTGTEGYVEYIAQGDNSAPIAIGLRAKSKIESKETKLLFWIEGETGDTCHLNIKTVNNTATTTYSYNKPNIRNNSSREVQLDDNYTELEVTIRTNTPNLRKENLKISLDGVEVSNNKSEPELDEGHLENGQFEYRFTYLVRDLPMGKHKLRVFSTIDQTTSDSIVLNYSGVRPNLHIVAIGPSYGNLNYTMKDARDFAEVMYRQRESGFFANVYVDTLIGENATAANIQTLLQKLVVRGNKNTNSDMRIKTNDYLVLFYSGHGTKVNEKFCLEPVGYNSLEPQTTAIRYDYMVNDYLTGIGCKTFIFIDACLSGAAEKGAKDLSDLIDRVNRTAPGITSISSCSANENSYEYRGADSAGNGVFTKALLEAFNFENVNATGGHLSVKTVSDSETTRISIQDLEAYLKKRVPDILLQSPELKRLSQHPVVTIGELHKELPVYISSRQ